MSEIKLKPCPFCNGKAEMAMGGTESCYEIVRCSKCYAQSDYSAYKKNVIEWWNTRPDDYKRGVVDGMTASANFVADDHLQGRDNDRMRLADSLRSEAKRVEQEK